MYKKINRIQMMEMLKSKDKDVTFLDVLPYEYFQKEHIKGSFSLPYENIDEIHTRMFDKSEDLVVYCASTQCSASEMAAEKLDSLGFKHVYDYAEGLEGYKEANLPLEGENRNY